MRTHATTRLLALILSLRYVARIQTSLNSCDRSQRQNFDVATMIFTCDTRRFVTGGVSQRFVASFVSAFNNDRATTTRHNYSKWRRPGNLKTKASVFDIYIFQTQTPSFEKLGTKFIVKTMFCGLELFSCFNGGFP